MALSQPFDLSRPVLQLDTRLVPAEGGFAVELGGAAWANACTFPPQEEPPGACVLNLEVQQHTGTLAIGSLSKGGDYLVDEVVLNPAAGWQPVSLRIAPGNLRGHLVLRKGADAICRASLRVIAVDDTAVSTAAVQSMVAIDQFIRAAADLASVESDHRQIELASARVIAQAGAALGRFGAGVVKPSEPAIAGFLAQLPPELLTAAAQAVTQPVRPGYCAGWRFDDALLRPDAEMQLRAALWRAMRDRCADQVIRLPWLNDTFAQMPLGSDLSLALFTLGQFEPNAFAVTAELLRPGDVFIDVGANEGLYSLMAAKAVGPEGMVVAIEPSPRELGRLRANIAGNRLEDRIVVIEAALAGRSGWATLAVAEAAHGGQNAFADRVSTAIAVDSIRHVPTLGLDMIAARLGSRQPDFIKIDIEGAEYEVLCSGSRVIDEVRPVFLVEIGRTGQGGDHRVAQLLGRAGYALYVIDDVNGRTEPRAMDADWSAVENLVAVPREKLDRRRPGAGQQDG